MLKGLHPPRPAPQHLNILQQELQGIREMIKSNPQLSSLSQHARFQLKEFTLPPCLSISLQLKAMSVQLLVLTSNSILT